MKTLESVLHIWDNAEHTVEEKLNALENYIFQYLGFKHEPAYYEKKGSFFARYCAGFINRYFVLIKNVSFILLDPLHIFDIITTFVKGILTQPIKTLKQIWGVWTYSYTHGIYGLGALTADALLATLIAGGSTALAEGEVWMITRNAGGAFGKKFIDRAMGLSNKFAKMWGNLKNAVSSYDELFNAIKQEPHVVLADAKKSLVSGVSYGKIQTYKYYTNPFLKQNKLS